jgi:3-oxoacyl-[acyl-carrier protein] reductase
MKLEDAKVLVTGGASGMGRAFCEEFAAAGAKVATCDLNEEALAELADKGIHTVRADVSSEEDVLGLIPNVAEALGGLNVLVNNAGIFRDSLLVKRDRKTGELKKMSLRNWQQVLDVDLTGPFLCTREFASWIIENEGAPGVVVNISSVARHGNRGQSNYSAAKAGLVADTRLWAIELARNGIRTGAVAPGFVDTPILQGMRPEVLESMLKTVPLGRSATTTEVFLAVKFIVECDYFTGRCIDLDGGLSV